MSTLGEYFVDLGDECCFLGGLKTDFTPYAPKYTILLYDIVAVCTFVFFVGIAFFVRKGGLSVKTEDFLFCVYRCPLSAQSPLSSVR